MYCRPITVMLSALPFGGSLRSVLAYRRPPPLPSALPPAEELGGFSIDGSFANVMIASASTITPAPTLQAISRRVLPRICAATARLRARWSVWDEEAVLLPRSYLTAIERAGGLAVMLPPDRAEGEDPSQLLELIDGLVLAGGADIDPVFYGQEAHANTTDTVPERDAFEIALARAAIERDMPLLGICRGMQLLNVACGGTLLQHLPRTVGHDHHRRTPGTFDEHQVELRPGSLAARATGRERESVKSHHHQGVGRIGGGLVVSG